MNFKIIKNKLTIKKAKLAVDYGYAIYKFVEIARWICENYPFF